MTATLQTILLNALWQLPLLTAAGLLAERLLRPFAPVAHYRLWLTVTALEFLIPLASAVPDTWVRTLAALFQITRPDSHSQITVLTGPATAITQLHLPEALRQLAFAAYLLLTAFSTIRLLWRSIQLAQLRRRATSIPLSPELQTLWQTYETRFQTRARLVSASGIAGPITIGLRAKLLILPAGLLQALPADELEAILAHEFAHMRRDDFASNLALQFLTLPIAFHPALWLTRGRLVQARELVCDRLAAAHTGRAIYTRSLLRLAARILANPSTPNAIGVFDAHPLERRLMNLTQPTTPLGRTRRLALIAATLALTTLTCGTALALRSTVAAPFTPQAQSTAAGPIRISGGVAAGNVLTKVAPVYPPDAKTARIQGSVVLHAIIGKDGKIQDLNVLSGPSELTQSAIDAVSQWVYKPYLLNGQPTEVETTITVTYSLGE